MRNEFTIKETHYYTYQDEKHFFKWLNSISGVEKVVGGPKGLTIHLTTKGLDIDDWADLSALLVRYGIDMSAMRGLVTPENEAWVKDPKRFWYAKIFAGRSAKAAKTRVKPKKRTTGSSKSPR